MNESGSWGAGSLHNTTACCQRPGQKAGTYFNPHHPLIILWHSQSRMMPNDSKNQTKDLAGYLWKHSGHVEIDDPWLTDNWYQWGKIKQKINGKRGSLKDSKGKGKICHALALCLDSAWECREQMRKENDKLMNEIQTLKLAKLSLQCLYSKVKQELKESKKLRKILEERLELTLLHTPKAVDVRKIQNLIMSPEDWDGDIWESSDENYNENIELDFDESMELLPLKEEEDPEFKMKPIIKTEISEGPQGGQR